MLLPPVRRQILEHRLLQPGDRVAVAFSGGADSLCLLHLLLRLCADLELQAVSALHVDHGLRPTSAEEAERAAALARALGVEAGVLKANLAPKSPGNLQERARRARLALMQTHARERGLAAVALGHTASDQAETVLMRLLRGAGARGLAGMAWRTGLLVRPLLAVTRAEVERYLARHGLCPVVDPTNSSDLYLRNRIRHRVLPLLEQENPSLVRTLCRLAESCREEDSALELLAQQALARATSSGGLMLLHLQGLDPGILHRVLRLAHARATGSTRRLRRYHLLEVVRLIRSTAGSASVDLPGALVLRQYNELSWRPRKGTPQPLAPVVVSGPGDVPLGDGRVLRVRLVPSGHELDLAPGEEEQVFPAGRSIPLRFHLLDGGRVRFPLTVRGPRPGDRIALGLDRSRKVARVLMDAKVPQELRPGVPLMLAGSEVVLVVGIRQAHGVGATGDRDRLLVQLLAGGAEDGIER